MNCSVILFKNSESEFDANIQAKVVSKLNGYALRPSSLTWLCSGDEQGFDSLISRPFDVLVVVNDIFAGFDLKGVLSDKSIRPDSDGFCLTDDGRLVCLFNLNDGFDQVFALNLSKLYGYTVGKCSFKLFGLDGQTIKNGCQTIQGKYDGLSFNVNYDSGDALVDVFYTENTTKMQLDLALKEFLSTFADNVYATDDISIEQCLYDMAKLRRLKISTAESMTGGRICSRIVGVDGASDVFYEGMVTYDTQAKIQRLDVSREAVQRFSVVSAEVAYEMALGLMKSADLGISITGYAGSKINKSPDDGLCFIGIAYKGRVNTYRFVFGGTRKENIEYASGTALFLAIKTIKNYD